MFFPQKDTSYREVRRVLAPGGRYLFSVWDSHRHNPFGRITHEIAASFFPTDPPQFYMVPFSYYQIDPIKPLGGPNAIRSTARHFGAAEQNFGAESQVLHRRRSD
jgi:hypothetical protein